MASEITYAVVAVSNVDPELMRDLSAWGKEWAVVRTSPISVKLWSFNATETSAKAAARRYRSKDIVTR